MQKKQANEPRQVMHTLTLGDMLTVNGETGIIVASNTIHGPGKHINVEMLLVEYRVHVTSKRHVTKCHVKKQANSTCEKKSSLKYHEQKKPSTKIGMEIFQKLRKKKVLPREKTTRPHGAKS